MDGIYGNGNDTIVGGTNSSIGGILIGGTLSANSLIMAGKLPTNALVNGQLLANLASDPRFSTNPNSGGVSLSASLQQDTGSSNTDRLTNNPTITGRLTGVYPIVTFAAAFNNPSLIFNVKDTLQTDGSFTLTRSRLEQINRAPLTDGSYTLYFLATDLPFNVELLAVPFTLDTTIPTLTLNLDPASDTAPVGDQQTTNATVTLTGQTEANSKVALVGLGLTTTANASGQFSFSNVALTLGVNAFTVRATDTAGNQRTESKTITRLATNQAPVNTGPGTQTVNEDTALAISGLSVTDVDGNLATTQLRVTNGTLTVSLAGGATISAGASGTNTLTLAGAQTQINAALGTVTYQGILHYNGPDTLTVTSTDSANATDMDTVAITVQSVSTTAHWINPAGGDWDVASNWDVGRVPGMNDSVIIDTPVTNPIVHGTGPLQVKSLTVSDGQVVIGGSASVETVSLSGGSLAFNGVTTATTLTQTAGTLTGSGVVTLTGSGTQASTWSAGTMTGSGTTLVQGDMNLTVDVNAPVLGRQLTVGNGQDPARLDLTGNGVFMLSGENPVGITVRNHATLNLVGDLDLAIPAGQGVTSVTVDGGGTVVKSGAGTRTDLVGVFLTNNSLVDIQSGTLLLLGGSITQDGNFNVAAGATLDFNTSSTGHVFAGNGGITGIGTVDVDGPFFKRGAGMTTTVTPTVRIFSSLIAESGTLVLTGTVKNNNALSVAEGATLTVGGNLTNYDAATRTLTGGSFEVSGVLRVANTDIVANEATVRLVGPSAQFLNHTTGTSALANFARNAQPGTFGVDRGSFTTSGSLTNSGLLDIGADGTFTVAGTFTNDVGIIRVKVVSTIQFGQLRINENAIFNNFGALEITTDDLVPLQVGDRFRFMTFVSRTGYFVQVSLPDGTVVDQSDPTFLELVVT